MRKLSKITLLLLTLLIPINLISQVIVEQDFDGASSWSYSSNVTYFSHKGTNTNNNVYPLSDGWYGDGFYGIISMTDATGLDYTSLNSNVLGERDLDDEGDFGTGGDAVTSFSSVNVSGCSNIQISFDYDIEGYNANSDEAFYEVFFDGVGQGRVTIQTGSTSGDDAEGTETINVPGGTSSVYLEIIINNNGTSGYSGFDNFILSGNCTSNTISISGISSTSFNVDCSSGDYGTIYLTSTETFNPGNEYNIELSDASGSFTSPQTIGSITSINNIENNISFTIPPATPTSTSYAIRVVSTDPSVISDTISSISITLSGGPCITTSYNCSSIIWYEDFESYVDGVYSETQAGALVAANNNTVNPNPDWTCHGNNCESSDGDIDDVNDNYFGVSTNSNGNKEFRVNDIEGITCCTNGQGENDNYWQTEEIDISSYTSISIAISARVEGDVECTTCGNGRDEFNVQYSTDGGATWSVPFYTICGATSGFTDVNCIDVTGSTLIIRVLLGNQANDENYFFDDIIVCESSCNVILPIELKELTITNENNTNVVNWITLSETNNSHFILERSTDGKQWKTICQKQGMGNTTNTTEYVFYDRDFENSINYYRLTQVDYDGESEKFNIISIDNRMGKPIKTVNLQGQEVNDNYRGIVIDYYSNGKVLKRFNK